MITERRECITEIFPDEHPHVLLHYFGQPSDNLSANAAVTMLHIRIAIATEEEMATAADKLANYCGRIDLSGSCLDKMRTIQANELHITPRQMS